MLLALVGGATLAAIYLLLGLSQEQWVDHPGLKSASIKWRLSMALAYTALLFLAATLAIGPLHALRHVTRPVNNMLRRDVAIWAGGWALCHMGVGMLIHTDGWRVWSLFVSGWPNSDKWLPLHFSLFGLANYSGLAQGALLTMLLLLSNNLALRRLGVARWKALQRLSYLALGLIIIHGLSYQQLEERAWNVRALFVTLTAVVLVIQAVGFATVRRRASARVVRR